MRRWQLVITGILISLPLLILVFLNLAPVPSAILKSNGIIQSSLNGTSAEFEPLLFLLEYEPWRGDLWERLGRVYLNSGIYDKAIDSFQKGEELSSLTDDGKIWMADALISAGEVTKAKDYLRQISLAEKGLFELLQVTSLQRRIGDVYGAESTLLAAHAIFPENEEVNFQLGLMLSTTQPDSAVHFLSIPVNLSINDRLLRDGLVSTIDNSSDADNVSVRYRKIGQVLSSFSEWDVAAQAFQSAVATDANSALNWILLAEAQQHLGIDASKSVANALELDPDHEIVNGLAGLYYRQQGKYELALNYLQKAINANSTSSIWIVETGNTYEEMGNLQFAYESFIKAVNLMPEDWTTWKALAVFCFTHNYEIQETGLVAARQALSLNPGSPVLTDLYGTGLMLVGDYDSAERFLMDANRMDPHQSAILIHLGQLKIAQGEHEQARDFLNQAIKYAPSNRLREFANQLLKENVGK